MALTTTLTIKYQGQPLIGATVIFGDYVEKAKTTDAEGKISASLADGYAAVEWVAIKHSSFPIGYVVLGIGVIEAGKNYEYDIPLISSSPLITQSNILREI